MASSLQEVMGNVYAWRFCVASDNAFAPWCGVRCLVCKWLKAFVYFSELTVAAPGVVASLASVAVPGLCSCRHVTRLLNRGHSF